MTVWIVIGCILLALLLIGQIRIGAAVDYSEDGLGLELKVGPVRTRILPAKENKRKKGQRPKREKTRATERKKRNKKDTLSLALRFVSLLGEAAGRFKRKIRIDHLILHVIWGNEDPASAAMGYGAGHAALGILWPAIEHNFKVKEYDLRVDVDFERRTPTLVAKAQATLTLWQIFSLSLRLGIKTLIIFLGIRREQAEKTKQEAVQA